MTLDDLPPVTNTMKVGQLLCSFLPPLGPEPNGSDEKKTRWHAERTRRENWCVKWQCEASRETAFENKTNPQLSASDRMLTILGLCDEAMLENLGPAGHAKSRKGVAKLVTPDRLKNPDDPDPLRDIIERLEIRRFLTTNYDRCIEEAFENLARTKTQLLDETNGAGGETSVRVRPTYQSFAFDINEPDALLQFAVGAPNHEVGVFHLHGVAETQDDQFNSMIVTEGDYQRLYLQDDARHRAYREALRLAFSANPVLFMGVGLTEADLLRPLRQFVSQRAGTRPEQPLFALYPQPVDNQRLAAEWRRYLYSRFGLKVLYYESKGKNERQMAEDLQKAVEDLTARWLGWWDSWRCKEAAEQLLMQLHKDN